MSIMRFISSYKIGSSHEVCEDYADVNKNMAALADGCSSSLDTDVGARILVKTFFQDPNLNPKDFIKKCALIAQSVCHTYCLDCTLGTLVFDGVKNCYVTLIGDGVIVLEKNNNEVEFYIIDYEHNAPVYLSYILGSSIADYKAKFGYWKCEILSYTSEGIKKNTLENHPIYGIPIYQLIADLSLYKKILIYSDGLNSFIDKKTNHLISTETLISKLKENKFEFKEILKNHHHYDDLAFIGLIKDPK